MSGSTKLYLVLLIVSTLLSCSDKTVSVPETESSRRYHLGFTPFPYDISTEAVQYSYNVISTEADIIAHHFDNGIPWNEALQNLEFHSNILADWELRKLNTPTSHKVYVAITPINLSRNSLAPYKAEENDMPLFAPWNSYSFNHPNVKLAYYNYAKRVIDFFNPDFLAIGIEVNLLINEDPTLEKWKNYVELHKSVFEKLKNNYPNLPILISFTGMDLIDGYTDANHQTQITELNKIIDYTDYFGISLHSFISKLLADTLDDSIFDKLFTLSNKPIAICETSYPAEEFSILENSITIKGSEEKQNSFFTTLFNKSDATDVKFIINFVIRDYDALWQAIGSPDDISKIWKDTGFYDQDGNPRKVQQTWSNKLSE